MLILYKKEKYRKKEWKEILEDVSNGYLWMVDLGVILIFCILFGIFLFCAKEVALLQSSKMLRERY